MQMASPPRTALISCWLGAAVTVTSTASEQVPQPVLAQWSLRNLKGGPGPAWEGSVPSAAACPAVLKGHPSVTFLSSMGVDGVARSVHRYPETDKPCGSRQRTTLKGPVPATEKGDASQALPQHPHSPAQAAWSPEQTWIFCWPAGLTYPDPRGCQQVGDGVRAAALCHALASVFSSPENLSSAGGGGHQCGVQRSNTGPSPQVPGGLLAVPRPHCVAHDRWWWSQS